MKKVKKGLIGYFGDIPVIINDNLTGDEVNVFWCNKPKKNRLGPYKW
jgi:hypothetical protein